MFDRLAPAACSLLMVAGLASASPAAAQTLDELVVLGHAPRNAETAAYRVTYRDIDIRTPPGEKELRRRVMVTATYVCAKLGERGPKSTCRTEAVSLVQPRIKAVVDRANLQKAAFKPGPAWTPPPGFK